MIQAIESLPPDQMTADLLNWRGRGTQGEIVVWGISGGDGRYRIIPASWLGIVERRARGLLADDAPEWTDFCARRETHGHLWPQEMRECK